MNDVREEILENIEKFKSKLKEEKLKVSYEELDKYLFIESYFKSREEVYFEEDFYETVSQVVLNIFKSLITNLEHYVNMRGSTPAANCDYEILKDEKELQKLYFQFHLIYKKHNILYLKHELNTKKTIEFMIESFEIIKRYYDETLVIEEKLKKNIEKKLKEIKKDDTKKSTFESSMYN